MPDVDKDLLKALKIAKNKPRNFLIIGKGMNCLTLIIEKRPIKDAAVTKARKEVSGNVVIKGVMVGVGDELELQVLEEPTIPDLKVKKFISDLVGVVFKPRYKVVAELVEVNDSDAEDSEEGETVDAEYQSSKTEQYSDVESVKSTYENAIADKGTDKSYLGENEESESEERGFNSSIEESRSDESKSNSVNPVDSSGGDANTSAQFNTRFKSLFSDIKARLLIDDEVAKQLRQLTTLIGALAKKSDFVQANLILDRVEPLLRKNTSEEKQSGRQKIDLSKLPRDEFPKRWAGAKDKWLDSLDTVNAQIERLGGKLRGMEDPQLSQIAEFGLAALTGNFKVPLLAGIRNVDGSTGARLHESAQHLQDIIEGFKKHIGADSRIKICDLDAEELFGVKTTIQASLSGGLDALYDALEYVPEE